MKKWKVRKKKSKILNVSCLWLAVLFAFVWYDSDLKTAFRFTLFIAATMIFIFNMIYAYQLLKEEKFKFSNTYWWRYFLISTVSVIVSSIIFLPLFLLKIGTIFSCILLVIFFIFDLLRMKINNWLKRK